MWHRLAAVTRAWTYNHNRTWWFLQKTSASSHIYFSQILWRCARLVDALRNFLLLGPRFLNGNERSTNDPRICAGSVLPQFLHQPTNVLSQTELDNLNSIKAGRLTAIVASATEHSYPHLIASPHTFHPLVIRCLLRKDPRLLAQLRTPPPRPRAQRPPRQRLVAIRPLPHAPQPARATPRRRHPAVGRPRRAPRREMRSSPW